MSQCVRLCVRERLRGNKREKASASVLVKLLSSPWRLLSSVVAAAMRSVTGGSKRDKRRRSLLEQGGVDEIITQLSLCLSHTRAVPSMSVSVHMCECAYLLERMYTYALVYAHFWLPSNVAFYFSACTHAICVCADTLCVEWWLHSPFWNVWPCLLGWKWSFEHLLCFAISSIYTRLFFCVCVYTYIYIYL